MASPKAKPSIYGDITDPEMLGYHQDAQKKWDQIAARQTESDSLQAQLDAALADPNNTNGTPREQGDLSEQINALRSRISQLSAEIAPLSGEAQVLETKRENRGATLKQGGVNTQVGSAGAEAVKNENLLSQNINQEITGRVARNTQQAREAQTSVNLLSGATRGRQASKAGQAGYAASSGTAGALADAATTKSEADLAAIEGYRVGRQNLLMGQGDAATKAAESLTGSINTTTADWVAKSVAGVGDVTGTLLKNVEQLVAAPGFSGDANTQGVKNSSAAVDTTLNTWSFDSYMNVLNTLSGHSANKSTWDQLLLEQNSAPVNPYGQYSTAIAPLTPVAGAQSNLLAAAAGGESLDNVYTLSGNKTKTGSLI